MAVVVHPRFAPPDRIRLWVGVTGRQADPVLQWALDGQARQPTALRPVQGARPAALLGGANPRRVFTGVYEFDGLQPLRDYAVAVTADGEAAPPVRVRTFPTGLPGAFDEPFSILCVSCYCHFESESQVLARAVAEARAETRPALTLLMGDQVYLDLPTLDNFKDDEAWL